jgi:hypothetical protein
VLENNNEAQIRAEAETDDTADPSHVTRIYRGKPWLLPTHNTLMNIEFMLELVIGSAA